MPGTLTISTLSDGTNSTSATNCISGSAKAWINFNGTAATVRASYNVSSVTRRGAGQYTVNFTNAFADANYAITAQAQKGSVEDANFGIYAGLSGSATTTAFNLTTGNPTANSLTDSTNVFAAVFR